MAASAGLVAVRAGLAKSNSNLSGPSMSKEQKVQEKVHKRHVECARDLVAQYDTKRKGKLNRDEVQRLLVDLSDGRRVSEDELDFVFKVADANGDKAISALECSTLLNCWDNYMSEREKIDAHFRKYDPKRTDRLNKDQLRWMLRDLTEQKGLLVPVTDEDVEWVLKQASRLQPGLITKPELRRVLALWETWEAREKLNVSCCSVQ